MNSLTNIEKFLSPNIEEISIYGLIFNLVIGLFLSLVIKKFYKLYGNSTSNRGEFSKIFPLITLVTILVISVVKSSLALSLGLVGALSIVRFRTPIKDPEELGFLFFSIAIGLGLGANQTLMTMVSAIIILITLFITKKIQNKKNSEEKGIYLNILFPLDERLKDMDEKFKSINDIVKSCFSEIDLNRIDFEKSKLEIGYTLKCENIDELQNLLKLLVKEHPGISINFIEQKGIPAI